MTIVETVIISLVIFAYAVFAGKRLMTYMHVLQQEDYDTSRLFKWIRTNGTFDKRITLALLALGGVLIFLHLIGQTGIVPQFFINFLTFILFVLGSYLEKDPRKSLKKRLVSTPRAKRLFFPAVVAAFLLSLPNFLFQHPWPWIFNVQFLPFLLVIVNTLLKPVEDLIQVGYWQEAQTRIQEYQPKIVGITGSYGKTSVKHILGHILSRQAPTLITPGSVNTAMGITRVIREHLQPNHRFLVVEMGAYGPGSIANLCKLTPPDLGVITSIGHAHYERFKSLDNVAQAKFELAQAAILQEGKVVIHERTLRFNHARSLRAHYPESFVVCGDMPDPNPHNRKEISYIKPDDMQIQSIEQRPFGLSMSIKYGGIVYSPEIPIYGLHHGHNIALAFAAAMELGVSTDAIQDALATLPQIRHRLEVIRQQDGSIIIDDAYNSNPIGFQSALGLLNTMAENVDARKILMTPGMIELGIAHNDAHQTVGEYAGQVCDVCIVVAPKRIPTFIKGFKSTGSGKTLQMFDTFQEAQDWYVRNKTDRDILLIENDLPDMYEVIPKM